VFNPVYFSASWFLNFIPPLTYLLLLHHLSEERAVARREDSPGGVRARLEDLHLAGFLPS
jgi:hypothetical protein